MPINSHGAACGNNTGRFTLIGQIRGTLIAKTPPEVLVDVAGVTYEIQVPMSTLYQLPDVGSGVLLHTPVSYTHLTLPTKA